MRHQPRSPLAAFRPALVAALLLTAVALAPPGAAAETIGFPGVQGEVSVVFDEHGVPTVHATNDHDAIYALGYLHARDRFFQMDQLRRLFSGTLAELLGEEAALPSDIELRTLGLRRAAEESRAALSPESEKWLRAYRDGVNAWINHRRTPLPPEYEALELTSVEYWSVIDSLTVAKGLAFALSFSLLDIELTDALCEFDKAGDQQGFDGFKLFSEDLFRSAPFDPTLTIPQDAGRPRATRPEDGAGEAGRAGLPGYLCTYTGALVHSYRERVREIPLMRRALESDFSRQGSNWWLVSGALTDNGYPALASDPHLDLTTPAVFHEAHLVVDGDGVEPMDVAGVTFPGAPGVVLGCNPAGCWGGTVHPMDVTDVYLEELVAALIPFGLFTRYEGELEPVELIFQDFFVNRVGDGIDDHVVLRIVSPLNGGVTIIVPRRNNGPIIAVEGSPFFGTPALSVMYTGWSPTREVDAIREFARASSVDEFRAALQFFDFGSQNWAWADTAGNIAYFASGEMPLREDLQLAERPDGGVPPYLIRDGEHDFDHEWITLADPPPDQAISYEILPFEEMPQWVDPAQGYIISANNDPVGNTLDNDPLNELRPGGGIHYLNPGYATGFRAGRIQQLFDDTLADDGIVTVQEVHEFQGNNQLLDAEVLVPYVSAAFTNAQAPDAPPELAALGADPEIAEAVGRLEAWDFSTPTGIEQGYDPGDDADDLPPPDQAEIDASVAATIYSLWRGQAVRGVIDDTMARVDLAEVGLLSDQSMVAVRHLLDTFDDSQGVGASGIDFFVVDGVDDPADERDVVLLQAVRDALDLAASEELAPAFDGSTNQEDYRWGKLHRIVFAHPLGGEFDIPPAGGFADLSPELEGLARAGGMGAVDASAHDARADGLDEFMFGSGPSRRFAGSLVPGAQEIDEVLPGGQSGVLGNPLQADQLRLWLGNRYKRLPFGDSDPVAPAAVLRIVPEEKPASE